MTYEIMIAVVAMVGFLSIGYYGLEVGQKREAAKNQVSNPHKDVETLLDIERPGKEALIYQLGDRIWHLYTRDSAQSIAMVHRESSEVMKLTKSEARQLARALNELGAEKTKTSWEQKSKTPL